MEPTERIIGSAMAVHRESRPGPEEKIYENTLCLELAAASIDFSQQSRFPVIYRGSVVGTLVPDLIVAGKIDVQTKVADSIVQALVAQVLSSPQITSLEVGLVLNFKTPALTFKRVVSLKSYRDPS